MRKFGIITQLLLVVISLVPIAYGADEGINNGLETDSARQLRIYKDTLLHRASDQSRLDTAIGLLLRGDRQAREVLMEVLVGKDNPEAMQAVCKALIKSRGWGKAVHSKKDFLEPLLSILIDTEGQEAKLAAEAMLIFDYRQISAKLKKLVRSDDLDRRIRLNIVYALKLRPDKEAISELVRLLDDKDGEVAFAAGKALQNWVPVGTDRQEWKAILQDLQRKNPSEIIRDRLVFQKAQMSKLETECNTWRKLYLEALEKLYESADDTAKGLILVDKLAAEQSAVKLWALDKVSHRSSQTVLPADFGTILLGLISNPDRAVRLKTAKVLSQMSQLDPAEKLLEQLKAEEHEDVRLAVFDALGEACYYAFSPGSEIALADEIRSETLEWAGRYIKEQNADYAGKSAEVIRKLLSLNGLDKLKIEMYLKLVAAKYEQEKATDSALAGELLGVMARLSGQGSYYRERGAKLFSGAFLEGLDAERSKSVRAAAVSGLINTDKAIALKHFRERELFRDNDADIKKRVIELCGEVGKAEDLLWLVEILSIADMAEPAWGAMIEVLRRQQGSVVVEWAEKFAEQDVERRTVLFEVAEKKAESEKNADLLVAVRSRLLETYLNNSQAEKIGELLSRRLGQGDLDSGDEPVIKLAEYFNSKASADSKAKLLGILAGIQNVKQRPMWAGQVKVWQQSQAEAGSVKGTDQAAEQNE